MALRTPMLSGLDRIPSWLRVLAGALVVVPALVNGAVDLARAVRSLPQTEAERQSVGLFNKHFNRQPVATFPVPIQHSDRTVEVRLSVFDDGDVYVEFGRATQWFPFPDAQPPRVASFSLISSAVAYELPSLRGFGSYQQHDSVEDHLVARERHWENGVIDLLRLDPRTGDVVSYHSRRPVTGLALSAPAVPPPSVTGQAVAGLAPIDLEQARTLRAIQVAGSSVPAEATTMSSTCFTAYGACTLVAPARPRSTCSCYGPFGSVGGLVK